MAVLIVTPGFAANEQDDTCIPPLQLLVQELSGRGYKVLVVPLEYPFSRVPYSFYGAKVFPCNGRNQKWRRWYTHYWASKRIRHLIEQHTVKIIFSFWLTQAWSLVNKLALPLPHYTVLMGQDVLRQKNRRYLKQLHPENAIRLIAVSAFQAAQLQQQTGITPAHIIPWGVENTPVIQTHRPVDILGAGALIPVKNWNLWLECVAETVRQRPETRAVLIGGGPLAAHLQRYAHELGIASNVQFTGHIERKNVLEWMDQSKILLHTSRYESFGYVLAEAHARQCAVISTPTGIAQECGWTAEDRDGLAEHIKDVLEDAPDKGLRPFTLLAQHTTDQYVALIEREISRNPLL